MLHEKKLLHFSGKMCCFLFKIASFVLLRPSAAFQRIKFNVLKALPTKTSLSIQEKCCKNPPKSVGKFDLHKSNTTSQKSSRTLATHQDQSPDGRTNQLLWRFLRYFSQNLSVKHIIRFYGTQM